MQESKSERTRMQAAMRLADVLLTREERELGEVRRSERVDTRTEPVAETRTRDETPDETAPVDKEDAIDRAFAFLKKGKATDAA
jgi:hypothetical protein